MGVLPFVPLPHACDPRGQEVPLDRYGELARFTGTSTRQEILAALAIVDPDGRLAPYYTLSDDRLLVRRRADDPSPVHIGLRAHAASPPARARRRIALDPGHAGGSWSKLEMRHFRRNGGPVVREGDLSWATARLVQQGLVGKGFEVHMLRPAPPDMPYPSGADPGFSAAREAAFKLAELRPDDPPWLAPVWVIPLWRERRRLQNETPFALYTRYDLRRRAAAAEAFQADVTLSLHYNFTESDTNGVLVFMPGSFVEGDLVTASQRFWAFRRVLDGTLGEARRLANAFGNALMRHLDLPALSSGFDRETGAAWLPLDPERGVHARDLAILRRTPGIALLLEGPCVNQSQEYPRLQHADVEVDGRLYPERVRQYANAVLETLRADAEGLLSPE